MPDIIKLLLQAEIDTESSVSKINADIKKIQEGVNGIKIETDKTSIKDTAEKFAGLNKQLKEMGQFDLSKTPIEKGMKIIGYSINDANDGTKKFTQTLNTGKDKIITYKGTINETAKSYEVLGKTVRQSTRENQTFWKELDIGIRRGMTWGIAMSAIYGNVRKVKDGIGFIQQLDKELTQVSIVSGKTREETSKLAQEYAKLGKEMNKTVSEISAVNTELVRQGLSLEESQKRLLTVMKLNAVSDVDMNPTETLKVITSSVNALKTEAENAADVILKASTISASSVGEIGEALTKTASSAQATGLSIEQVSSIIATLEDVTQESASSLGNSVKTLLARFNKIDEETGGFNKNLNDVQKAFESVGVTFTEADGSIRSFYDLMTDLNAKGFKDMDKNTKSYIANMAAGVRQQNRFIALADNWNKVVDIQGELADSAGTLDQAYSQWLNSTEASANRAKIALEQMWINTINSDAIKSFYELSTAITTIIDKLGAMNVAVFTLSAIMLKGNDSIKRFLLNLSQLPSLMSISIAEMGLFKGSLFALKTTMDLTGVSAKLMWGAITLGASFAITKAIEGITKLINKQAELKHSNEELALNYKNTVLNIGNKQKRLSELGDSYDNIRKKIDNHIDLTESEKTTLNEMTQMFPELIKGYDNQGNAIIDTTKTVDGLSDSLEKLIDVERRAFLEGSDDIFKETEKDIKKAQQAIEDLNYKLIQFDNDIINNSNGIKEVIHASIETQEKQYEMLVKTKGEESKQAQEFAKNLEEQKKQRENTVAGIDKEKQVIDEAIAKRKELATTTAEVMAEYKKMPNALKNIVREQIDGIDLMNITADEMAKKVQDVVKSLSDNRLNKAILDYDILVQQYKLGELTAEQFDKAVQELIKHLLTILEVPDDIITRLFPDSTNIKSISDDTLDLATYFQVLGGSVSDAVDKYELLNDALYELQTEGHLSRVTLDKLLEVFPDLIAKTGLQTDKLYEYIGAQKNAQKETIDSQIAQTKSTMDGVWKRITGYQTEIEAMQAVAEARKALAGVEYWDSGMRTGDPELDAKMADRYAEARATINRADAAKAELEQLRNKLSGQMAMKSWFGDADKSYQDKVNKHNKSGSKKSKSKKDEPKFIDPIDAEIRAIQSKNDYLEKTNELLNEQLNLAKDIEGIEGLNEQYKINGQIIENNKKLLQSYKKEQDELHNKANKLRNSNKKYNIDSWFDANGEQTQAYINQYNRASKKEQENMDKIFQQMQKYKKAWIDADKEAKNVVNTTKKLEKETENLVKQQQDLVRNQVRDLIEAEKRNAYMDLERRQRIANDRLKAAKQEMENEVARYQSRIDSIQAEIDLIQESERARQENLERAKRLEEISKLQNKYYTLQYQNLSTLTEEQAKALGLEKEREQYLERQAKIQELLIKLENVRREKNIQQLTKANDGTWQFEYVADEKEIDNINKQVEDLQKEHSKSLKDLKEQTLDDLRKAQESYDEWERQNDIRRQIEEKQRRIQRYQDEITDLQNQYAEKERITNEAFERERENLDRYYTDIDILTDEKMKELYETFEGNWLEIHGMLTGYFESIRSEYEALVNALSQPLPTPEFGGSGGGDYGYYDPPSGGTSFSGSNKNTDWSKMYMDARAKGDWRTMEHANRQANIERGLGDKATATTDIEYIKKKVKGYSTGIEQGLITKDHLAMLHGDKTNWEGVFTKDQLSKLLKSAVLSTVNLVTPKMPNVALGGAGGGDTVYYINEMKLPNVTDFDSFKKEFDSQTNDLPNKAIMKVKKIGK